MNPISWGYVLEYEEMFLRRDFLFKEAYDEHIFRGPIVKIVGIKLGQGGMIQLHLGWTATKSKHMPWTLHDTIYPGISLSTRLVSYGDGTVGYEFPSKDPLESSWGKILLAGDHLALEEVAPYPKVALR